MARQSPGPITLVALVALGGTLGGLTRFVLLELAGAASSASVLVAVNVLGSGLLGLLVGMTTARHAALRHGVGTGFLGGFTTFSAAVATSSEVVSTHLGAAVSHVALTLVASVAAAGLGVFAGERLAPHRMREPA